MSPQIQQNPLVCQFCMLQDKEHDISRIAWSDWQDSPLAAMYESVMKQPVSIYILGQALGFISVVSFI